MSPQLDIRDIADKSSFLRNYLDAFPGNLFGLFWVRPFIYRYQDYGISYVIPLKWFDGQVFGYFCREIFGPGKVFIGLDKRKYWYGMDFLKNPKFHSDLPVILVEGPKDRISISRYYPWVIAVMGTGLGRDKADVLASAIRKVIIMFDGDGPGRERAAKIQTELNRRNVDVETYYLLSGTDPGDYIDKRNFETDRLKKIIVEDLKL